VIAELLAHAENYKIVWKVKMRPTKYLQLPLLCCDFWKTSH